MANKKITDVDFIDSLNSDESFFINHNNSIKQINKNNITLDIISGGTGAKDVINARANLEAQKQHVSSVVTLSIGEWDENVQTVYIDGVTEDNTVIVAPTPSSRTVYMEADVRCSAQSNKSLTFECEEKPKIELTVNVLIFD